VPYRGGGPAMQDALAGHVPLFMSNIVIILNHIREGRLRALGVSQASASRFLPGVVPFAEQGFTGFDAQTYWVMVGPAGIAPDVTARMQQAIAQAMAEPQVQARMADQGAEILANKPAEAAGFIRAEIGKWGEVIRVNSITADG